MAGSLKVGPSLDALSTVRKMALTAEPRKKAHVKRSKKVSQLKFAFGEFYLSLILLQNYQVKLQDVEHEKCLCRKMQFALK